MISRGQVAVAAAVVAGRAAAAWWAVPVVMPDSERYRDRGDPLAPFEVWNGEGPGVLLQLLGLLPADLVVVAQTLLAASCWAVAAVYLGSLVDRRVWSWLTFAAATAYSLSPWFVVWDDWLITEALMLGGCALAAVGMGAWVRSRPGAVPLAIAGISVAVLARPFVAVLLLPLVVLAIAVRRRRDGGGVVVTAGALLGVFASWQVLTLAGVEALPYSYLPEPESLATVQATDRLAGRGDVTGYLDLAREHGMPSCPAAEAVVTGPGTVFDRVVDLRAIEECPGLDVWLADGGLPWPVELTENTTATFGEFLDGEHWVEDAFVSYSYSSERTLLLREQAGAGWPEVRRAVNVAMLAATSLTVAFALVVAKGRRLFVLAATSWSVLFAVGVLAVDGMEYWRHALPAFPTLTLLVASVVMAGTQKKAPPFNGERGRDDVAGEVGQVSQRETGTRV